MIAVILAGGSGTRFWPLSRNDRPKQLIRLFGERVMIAQTFERLARVVTPERVYVVCGPHLVSPILAAIPELRPDHVIVEPMARNTAPAIMLASAAIEALHGEEEPVGIFPSDHFIGQPERFAQTITHAYEEASRREAIVTLGITPTRPETGYGYILRESREEGEQEDARAFDVSSFVEKPDVARALQYLQDGNYFWNAGMFFFRPGVMNAEFARQRPDMHVTSRKIVAYYSEHRALQESEAFERFDESFAELEKISIDYAVMEGARSVRVVPASFPWSDVGHWAALDEVCEPGEEGNVLEAPRVTLHDVKNSIIYSDVEPARRIAAVGLDGMIVVDTADALLVMPKDRAQDVRAIVSALPEEER